MHGFSSGSVLVVNAEVDSMGGVVEGGGVGSVIINSPQRVVIEKVQAELRQEYDVREERRRELEFLEKGGDPLEFKLSTTFSLSRQSTSMTDQQLNQFLSSEAKGSFARATSPDGDSVESSGRPVVRLLCEPDCADNLVLFDGENEFPEVDKILTHPSKCIITPSEQSSQLDVYDNSKELKSSAAFNVPRNSYRRRSRPNHDDAKTGSNNNALARNTSLSFRHLPREVKGLCPDVEIQMNQTVLVNPKPVPPSPMEGTIGKSSENPSELDGVKTAESTANAFKDLINDQHMLLTAQRSPGVVLEDQERSYKKEDFGSAVLESQPCVATTNLADLATCGQEHGCGGSNDNMNDLCVDVQKNSVAVASKVLDSESSCTDMGNNTDGYNSNELYTHQKGAGNIKEHILVPRVTVVKEEAPDIVEQKETQRLDSVVLNDDSNLNNQNQENESQCGADKEVKQNSFVLGNTVKDPEAVKNVKPNSTAYSETGNLVTGSSTAHIVSNQESVKSSLVELSEPKPSIDNSAVTMDGKEGNAKAVSKADEDAVLKEAGVIEAKHKRIVELSATAFPVETCRKSHWDYVLDEMAWLANDFAQERLWKMTAAARLCHRVAYTSQFRFQEKHRIMEQKRVAHLLSDAVIQFWNSVQDSNKDMPLPCCKDSAFTIRQYAVKFLKFNSSFIQHNQAEAPATPDRNSDLGTVVMSCDDNWTEDNLFYLVPSGAMKTYRKSIESHVTQYEKTGSSLQEEVEPSALNAATAYGAFQNAYEDEEGETSTYDCDIIKSSRHGQKKRKLLPNGYGRRSYEVDDDLMYTQCIENKLRTPEDEFKGKRPAGLNVSIPTKRVRTASRQRVVSPFTAGTSGYVPLPSKADASSSDTNSIHDGLSTPYGGSIMPNSLEGESVRDFGKKSPFDCTEVSKPRKKKKRKHLGSAYEQRWQVDSNFQSEQSVYPKTRSEGHQLESNGCGEGLLGQHIMKKPKVMRPAALKNTFDNIPPVAGSVPSPVASQTSNMPNPNIKIIGGGERSRKTKTSKVPIRQGSGSPWSQFEDQALIVLVHDMGPNWELVSDAINCTLQFKYVYRKPNECKERHMAVMDKTTGDGADSAEDSGSSQPYRSTLPGIPKGSARQLFQQLQKPIEEETLKSHFEKIIKIGQKQHHRKSQNGNNDPKPRQQPHSSHMLALSQVCPNNLNGVPVLTPFDLCDETTSNPEIPSLGYQSPHNNFLPMSNPASAPVPALQGPATMLDGNNFSSPGSLYPYVRDGRLAIPRSASLSIDEQQKMQQYNQMFPARNIQQPSLTSFEPGTDRGMRMLPGAMGGVHRSGPVPRPGFQTMAPSPTLNSGVVHPSGMIMKPSPVNMLSGSRSGQGNSVMRARDSLHMMRGVNQASNPQHKAHALRLMKERQLQRIIHQQQQQKQQQLVSSNAVLPHAPPPAQHPVVTSLPNSSQVQLQISSPPVSFSASAPSSSLISVPHNQHKHQMPPHGLVRNVHIGGSGLANHVGKQKRQPQQQQQPQPFQQAGRCHPEQRQQPPSQPHTKPVKGVGRGNLIQQSTSVESCLPNGLSTTPGNQSTERFEQAMDSAQVQGLYMGSPLNSVHNTRKLGSPNSSSQCQPVYPGQVAPASNNIEIEASHSDYKNSNLTPVSSVFHKYVAPIVTASSNHQQPQQQVKSHEETVNHNSPAVQIVLQPSPQVNSDMTTKLQRGEYPVELCNISNTSQPDGTASQAGNNATKVIPVVSSFADKRNASEQVYDSVTWSPSSSSTSAGMHLADGAEEAMKSVGCKQSSQKDPSPLSQSQQPASPISQL